MAIAGVPSKIGATRGVAAARGRPGGGHDQRGDEGGLGLRVTPTDFPNLPFSDHRHCLVARQRSSRRSARAPLEGEAGEARGVGRVRLGALEAAVLEAASLERVEQRQGWPAATRTAQQFFQWRPVASMAIRPAGRAGALARVLTEPDQPHECAPGRG